MASNSSHIISHAASVSPDESRYIINRIGGINYSNSVLANTTTDSNKDAEIDNDQQYVKDQKYLIEQSNDTLYKRDQHNLACDLPKEGYDHISKITPLGMSMLSNHADRGYDYRDFPSELAKDKAGYDPYLGYLHEYGLIGKNKSRYNVDYINIDSANRTKYTTATTKYTVKLDRDPLLFTGTTLRLYVPDVSVAKHISLHDKITINGVAEKEITIRSIVTNDFGTDIHYFLMENKKQYMTVTADNNVHIDTGLITDIRDIYTDMMVDFRGFVGDKKIEWYFDTRMFVWDIRPLSKNDGWRVRIMENVFGTSKTNIKTQYNIKNDDKCCCNDNYCNNCGCMNNYKISDEERLQSHMMIADFVVDMYGSVIKININTDNGCLPYRSDIVWTDPLGISEQYHEISEQYYTEALTTLTMFDLHTPPTVPTTFYKTMEYIDKVQNVIRPIFLRTMKKSPHFIAHYESKQKSYVTTVRLVVPEAVKITQTSMIGNIPVNMLNSRHKVYLTHNEIEKEVDNNNVNINIISSDIPQPDKFYIKLNNTYERKRFEFNDPLMSGALQVRIYEESISDIIIKYEYYGGVPIKFINSDYPIGFDNVDGFKYVNDIVINNNDNNSNNNNMYIVVELDRVGYFDKRFGGDNIYIGLIDDIDIGYPNPNRYTIDLERIYTNVVAVRMVGSCFPKTQNVITDGLGGGKRNNRFYWQNVDDGDIVYRIELPSGNYTPHEFKDVFERHVQKVKRVCNNTFNHITLDIDTRSELVVFTSYNKYTSNGSIIFTNKTKLSTINQLCSPNSIKTSNQLMKIDDTYYQYPTGDYFKLFPHTNIIIDSIRITIYHPNNNLIVGDTIIISGSLNFGDIPAKYINGQHIITRVTCDYYDILLNNINLDCTLDLDIIGGDEIVIHTPNLIRIRFDYKDTFGTVLGFRNVGGCTSVTPYSSIITNNTLYDNERMGDVVQKMTCIPLDELILYNVPIHGPLQFEGPLYLLIVCEQLSTSQNLGNIKDYFYRIDLPGHHGLFIYHSYVKSPLLLNDAIGQLDSLTFDIYSPDGSLYEFNGKDHSFVLELVTYDELPDGTRVNIH